MMNCDASSDAGPLQPDVSERASPLRKPYEKPVISDRGRLVEVALGGSPGTGDSGGGGLVENPLT